VQTTDLHQWLAFAAFAVVGSFTPGPNNAIALATGVNFGWLRVLPHAAGVTIGFSAVLAAAAAGALGAVLAIPGATPLLKAVGVGYLLWLAWLVAGRGPSGERPLQRPLTVWQSALLQLVNPKGWLLAVAVASTWFAGSLRAGHEVAVAIAAFALLCAASNLAWAVLGAGLQRWLRQGARLVWFNRAMGVALATSALAMVR
jgi:threonine/homoserine/homoserine lactone efflux protein